MTPMSEDGGPLREWSPLTNLLQQIPMKLQNGLFTQDIVLTCIDVVPEFIAIGTNCGIVYWFDRETGALQRLRCENIHSSITCLSVISTVDFMVAAGNNQGVVTVFQIPKNHPESLPDSLKPKEKKQIERYNIGGLHKTLVTAVEWSKNGMKLFSGDKEGLVVLTEIDFYMHLSKSSELLNEKYMVVQLSYQQGLLLVSTLFRTILVDKNQNNKVSQVGQKERKSLGKLGAVFGKRQIPIQEPTIYTSRPGLRLWQADRSGTVLKTLIFKETLHSNTEVTILNPAPETIKKKRGEPSFGILLPFCDDLFVTYSDDVIHVINPITIAITSVVGDLRKITDVACTKDEIFVLEGGRNIVRIAYHPESCITETTETTKDSFSPFIDISKPVTASIFGITSKLKENSIVPTIPFHKINPNSIFQAISGLPSRSGIDPNPVVNAEEATEMPQIVPLPIDTPLVTEITVKTEQLAESQNSIHNSDEKKLNRRQIFQKIGEQEFEDVVFTPEKRNKNSEKYEYKEASNNGNLFPKLPYDIHETYSSLLTLSIDDDTVLKSERNLELLQKDVENKEKLLADVLNFDLSEYMSSSQIFSSESNTNNLLNTITYVNCTEPTIDVVSSQVKEVEPKSEPTDNDSEEESYSTELEKLKKMGECSKNFVRKTKNNSPNHVNKKIEKKKSRQNNCTDVRELEMQFNALSKELVSSAIYDEEDWVIIPSND